VIPTTTEESNWNSAYSASHTQNTDTGTSNNSWDIGDNTDNDKYLYAKNGDANKPGIKYNHTSNKWQYANDGITWSDMGSGGGTWGSITGTISSQTDLQTQFALYALLGGLAGGQLLKGGTGANENIQLQSTNHATRGYIESIDKHKFDTLAYFIEFDNGNSGTSKTIDWTANGNKQKITTTGSCTVTFTNPTGPCNLIIRIVHEASTTAYTYTWPATVKWPSGSSGKLATTNTSGSVDIVSFYFDGTNYNAQGAANFS
jgi:hypothetical protein